MNLIATWKITQNEETEDPCRVGWENGEAATMDDFRRILPNTQTDAVVDYNSRGEAVSVSYGYRVRAQESVARNHSAEVTA